MPVAPEPDAATPPPQAPNSIRSWHFWKMPVLAGFGFCALQGGLLVVRFGFSDNLNPGRPPGGWIAGMLPGLSLFFLAGLLAALLVRRLLRGAQGSWRVCLIVLTVVATPIALLASLVGGLLGPPLVVLYASVPYMIFVGIPVLGRRLWLLLESRAGS
ncbi:MAG: hypothetical protein OXN96_20820 [Bryobacterales bacterium]|nr:hypothetical protein [Bryobacterales bacterium]